MTPTHTLTHITISHTPDISLCAPRPATHARNAPNSIHTRYVLHTYLIVDTIPGSGLESAALDILDTCVFNLGGSF